MKNSNNAVIEIISAISALNTLPKESETILSKKLYISEQIEMVAHAIEHLQRALELEFRSGN